MSLVVNNNMMAANTARTLNQHYGRLQTSTQRLSSGLRINSAADDAAGLAIRELQRADIASLHQGARNANDAISMIQTADGALGVIDEKLIRMKELAEQAATGTYDSTQRLMIESEYQAMASEITRIANATDFNGTKLLDGTLSSDKHDGSGLISTGKMKIHFGTGNDSAEDYYYIKIGNCTAAALGVGNDAYIQGKTTYKLPDVTKNTLADGTEVIKQQIVMDDAGNKVDSPPTDLITVYDEGGVKYVPDPATAGQFIRLDTGNPYSPTGAQSTAKDVNGNELLVSSASVTATPWATPTLYWKSEYVDANSGDGINANDLAGGVTTTTIPGKEVVKKSVWVDNTGKVVPSGPANSAQVLTDGTNKFIEDPANPGQYLNIDDGTVINPAPTTKDPAKDTNDNILYVDSANLDGTTYWQSEYVTADDGKPVTAKEAGDVQEIDGGMVPSDGFTVSTQEAAQKALVAINDAIVSKDKIRAHLGAMQNRLENTITNLNVQAENLQAAESRISDVDVATEMTQFVRNQILTQSAVAMLGQANSLPQMAMQLIGG